MALVSGWILRYFGYKMGKKWPIGENVFTKMISAKSSTKLNRKKPILRMLCFLWLTTHGTTPLCNVFIIRCTVLTIISFQHFIFLQFRYKRASFRKQSREMIRLFICTIALFKKSGCYRKFAKKWSAETRLWSIRYSVW